MDDRILDNPLALTELTRLMFDQHLGKGSTRDVWGSSIAPDIVLKFETVSGSFANVAEWELWKEYRYDDRKDSPRRWLAPCLGISGNGVVLAMARCEKMDMRCLPDLIPSWATDVKLENWGMYTDKEFGRRPVMVDYHITTWPRPGRLKKPDWSC